jgi:hypothetical protein
MQNPTDRTSRLAKVKISGLPQVLAAAQLLPNTQGLSYINVLRDATLHKMVDDSNSSYYSALVLLKVEFEVKLV